MIKKIILLLNRVILLPNLAHEILHYLPARYWGLEPTIDHGWSKVRRRRTTDGRTLVIVLMPAFVGALFTPILWAIFQRTFFAHSEINYLDLAAIFFWTGWMGACAKDIYKAGYFILFRKWHDRKENEK